MITRLRVSDYKSIGRIDVELRAFSTLVGPNGSGKSNVADVLRFLADCLNNSLVHAIAARHGFRAIRRWDINGSHAVDIGITARTEGGSGLWRLTLVSTDVEDGFRVDREYALWSPTAPVELWDLDKPDEQIQRIRDPNDTTWLYSDTAWLRRDRSPEYEAGIDHRTAGYILIDEATLALPHFTSHHRNELVPLKEELRQTAIYNPFPNTLRMPQKPNPIPPMTSSGEDWASKLKSLNKATWGTELIAALHRIVGDIDDYRVQDFGTGTWLIPQFRHGTSPQGRERWLDAAQESDGTLRLAAILTALFQEPTLSLIGFEEPELAVHPGAIPILFDFLKEASTRSQVLLTTHSPDLLDLLPIDDVRVVERRDGATTVSCVEERQRELVKKRLISTSDLLHAEGLHTEGTETDGKAHLIIEGHGETEAARNLVIRLWADLGLPYTVWAIPKRGKALHTKPGVLNACELLRSERDCSFALLLRDQDDGCPATSGPETARWVESAALPFPVAVVLAHREYESWFLPCVHLMAGREIRPGVHIVPGAEFEGDPEGIRGVKEWLTAHYPRGKAYKPTLDQLPLTRMLDFLTLRASGARSFATLERALQFLAMPGSQRVYPPPR